MGSGGPKRYPLGSGWQPGPDLSYRAQGFYLDGVRWAALGTQAQVGVAPSGFTACLRWERPQPYPQSVCFAGRLSHWPRGSRQWAASFEMGVLHPSPPPFFSGEDLFLPGHSPFLWASLSPDPPEQKERKRLRHKSGEREKRALYKSEDRGLPPQWRSGHSRGWEGVCETDTSGVPLTALLGDAGMWPELSRGSGLGGCQGWMCHLQMKCRESL